MTKIRMMIEANGMTKIRMMIDADRIETVPSVNSPVKDRVNCVNALLRNYAGQHRMLVDQSCKSLVKDFEQVSWKSDPHGNILADLDKSDPKLTHMSDAVGYYVAREFSMRPIRGEMGGRAIV
jgi:hypothetical protein